MAETDVLEDPAKPLGNIPDSKRTGFKYKGKEILLTKVSGKPPQGLVKKGMEKGIYPDNKRIEACTLFAVTGSVKTTGELAKIPEATIRKWRKEQWWLDLLHEIRQENNAKLDADMTEVVHQALQALKDRLINGDHKVLKDGTVVRVPVAARDLSIVAAIQVDKRQLLRGEPTSRSESVGKIEDKSIDKLERLAQTFEDLARFGRKPRVIDASTEPSLVEVASDDSEGVVSDSQDTQGLEGGVGEGEKPLPTQSEPQGSGEKA